MQELMQLITDSREQNPLIFAHVDGIEFLIEALPIGDYGAKLNGVLVKSVCERKSIADLFSSFSSGYENEKSKIEKAKLLGFKYILAIEGTIFDVREGYQYQKDGEWHQSKKDGLSQCKQLMTMYSKGYFDIWWCKSRAEMSFMVIQYFQAVERILKQQS